MSDIVRKFKDEIISCLQDKEGISLRRCSFEMHWVHKFFGEYEEEVPLRISHPVNSIHLISFEKLAMFQFFAQVCDV